MVLQIILQNSRVLEKSWKALYVVLSELEIFEKESQQPECDLSVAMEDQRGNEEVHALNIPTSLIVEMESGENWEHVGVALRVLREILRAVHCPVNILLDLWVFLWGLELVVYQEF